jgi:hypothetical protein
MDPLAGQRKVKSGAFIPPYATAALLAVAACRTVADGPSPPAAPIPPPAVSTPAAPSVPTPVRAAPTVPPTPETVSFEASVKPLLARTCTPCHVPGGRMYERMPFDRPEVVFSHKEGVLRRLKNPDDRQVLERWFGSLEKS